MRTGHREVIYRAFPSEQKYCMNHYNSFSPPPANRATRLSEKKHKFLIIRMAHWLKNNNRARFKVLVKLKLKLISLT